MKNLKILIVEDEILIAEMIKEYLHEAGHHVINIAISYAEALHEYNQQKPDLILLDIRLYGLKSGIDFAKYLESNQSKTPIIYLSSQYDKRTIDYALDTHPYGYLTKPIQKETLWTSISAAYSLYESNLQSKTEISFYDGKTHHIIFLNDILYIESDHVYLNVYLTSGKYITVRQTLKQLMSEMPHEIMVQCHRSYLVNKTHIKSWSHSHIILKTDKEIPVSRNFKEDFNNALQNNQLKS